MKQTVQNSILALALGVIFTGCVSNRRFQTEVEAKNSAQTEAATARSQAQQEAQARQAAEAAAAQAQQEIVKGKTELAEKQMAFDKLQNTYDIQLKRNDDLQTTNDRLTRTYKELLELNDRLKKDAEDRKDALAGELRDKQRELDAQEAKLKAERDAFEKLRKESAGKDASLADLEAMKKQLEAGLADREARLKKLETDLADREKRVKELETAIADRDAKSKALKDKLADALRGFNSSDLSVEERNGKVYVSLSQNLLFASGSSKLDTKGAGAIAKLSEVLNKSTDLSVLIEGHTDSDGDEKTNWKLSTDRSLSILDEMLKNKVNPDHITAAGRGEHAPIAPNTTPEGKAKNRRTEIILEPKLDAIFNILKN